MDFTFNNRVAFVTGASRGIGKAIAVELAKAGCKVMCASRDIAACRSVVDEIAKMGFYAEAYQCDVSKSADVNQVAEAILSKYEKVDIVVNNAGILKDNILAWMSDEEWHEVINVNLSGAFYVSRAFVPGMIFNDWGRIINISSTVALYGNVGQVNYASSKGGLMGMTKSLACELASKGISVNAIAPNLTDTELFAHVVSPEIDRLKREHGRLASVEDVAYACKYLASEEAGYVTGQVIEISAGRKM